MELNILLTLSLSVSCALGKAGCELGKRKVSKVTTISVQPSHKGTLFGQDRGRAGGGGQSWRGSQHGILRLCSLLYSVMFLLILV